MAKLLSTTINGGLVISGPMRSNVSVNNNILEWTGSSANGKIRKVTNQGGVLFSTDSSMWLHAGDNSDTLATDAGAAADNNSENIWLMADNVINIVVKTQNGYDSASKFIIDENGFSGKADTANTLATARTINGTSFNGGANITTANWGTARTLTIGSTGKSVNGSGNVTWSLTDIGAAASSHSHSVVTTTANGFMAAADKTKLNGIAAEANKYVHPNDANTRHITDTERTNWNDARTKALDWNSFKSNGGTIGKSVTINGTLTTNGNVAAMGTSSCTGRFIMRQPNEEVAKTIIEAFDGENSYGFGIAINAGGLTIIGGGESASSMMAALIERDGPNVSQSEQFYATSDNHVFFASACNTIENRKVAYFNSSGNLHVPGAMYVGSNAATGGDTSNRVYAENFKPTPAGIGALDLAGAGKMTGQLKLTASQGINFNNDDTLTYDDGNNTFIFKSDASETASKVQAGVFRIANNEYARIGLEGSDVYISNQANNFLRLRDNKTMQYAGYNVCLSSWGTAAPDNGDGRPDGNLYIQY